MIQFSTITDKNTYNKSGLSIDIECVTKTLIIADYSDRIAKLLFIYVITEPGGALPRKNSGTYSWKKQMFTIYRNIDFHEFMAADNEYALHLLALTFLEGIEQHLLKRKDFDGKQFYTDVERLFEPYLMTVAV